MDDYTKFSELSEQLASLIPPFVEFCSKHEYSFVDSRSLGRYPRVRVEKVGDVIAWFELWMCLDPEGNRYESFFETIPFELSAGVYVDLNDQPPHGCRYYMAFSIWERRPFSSITSEELIRAMELNLSTLNVWSIEMLRVNGKPVILPVH